MRLLGATGFGIFPYKIEEILNARTHFRQVHTTAGNKSKPDKLTKEFNQIMLKSDPGKVFRFNYNNSDPNYFHCYEHYQDVGKQKLLTFSSI